MKAEVIAVGTELLMGQIANTNAQYLSQRLPASGIGVYYHSVVGDNPQRLKEGLKIAMNRSDIILLTGGLGPTQDDLTKETVAEVLGLEMECDQTSADSIREYFSQVGKPMVDSNLKQACFPKGAMILRNDKGTAPGCLVETERNTIVMLPGPPSEMIPMYECCVEPYFKQQCKAQMASAYVKITGVGESKVEEVLMPLIDKQTNPTFATYAKTGDVTLRITASADTVTEAEQLLQKAIGDVKELLGDKVYSVTGEELEEVVVKKLIQEKRSIATAESCTGGLLAEKLTAIPGISEVMGYGLVTYSNESKMKLLGVKKETLEHYGAVSKETAMEMCAGLRQVSGADLCISVTGIAGPAGGSAAKPVGLVYIGIRTEQETKCLECHFSGTRERIRTLTVLQVMEELLRL